MRCIFALFILCTPFFFSTCSEDSSIGFEDGQELFVCYSGPLRDFSQCFFNVAESISSSEDYYYLDPYEAEEFPAFLQPILYRKPIRFLNLKDILPSIYLSPDFRVEELLSIEKGPYGIISPTLLERLQSMRDAVGSIIVYSGYRSPGYNQRVGGVRWSRHQYGDAVDIYAPNLEALAQECLKQGASFYQIYSNHVHCDWREEVLPPVFFGKAQGLHTHEKESISFLTQLNMYYEKKLVLQVQEEASQLEFQVQGEILKEDAGELHYNWQITLPHGELCHSLEKKILCPKLSGAYSIQVSIGASIQLNRQVFIP